MAQRLVSFLAAALYCEFCFIRDSSEGKAEDQGRPSSFGKRSRIPLSAVRDGGVCWLKKTAIGRLLLSQPGKKMG